MKTYDSQSLKNLQTIFAQRNHSMKTMKNLLNSLATFILAAVCVIITAGAAYSQTAKTTDVPHVISYQGMLMDNAGAPIADGAYTVTVRLYSDAAGTQKVYEDAYTAQTLNGVFSIQLGSGATALPIAAMSAPLWLGVQPAGGDEMRPLSPLTASPYALGIANGSVTAEKMGTPYVSGIYVNGELATANGGALNIMGADGALQFDPMTNTLTLGSAAGTTGGGIQKGGGNSIMNTPVSDNATGVTPTVQFQVPFWTSVADQLSLTSDITDVTGDVGIDNTSPSFPLDVTGDINTSTLYRIGGSIVLDADVSSSDFNTLVGFTGNSRALITGQANTATGDHALLNLTSANNNTAFGAFALKSNQSAGNNTAIGESSMQSFAGALGVDVDNTGLGESSLFSLLTGKSNTAIGVASMSHLTGGDSNTAVGFEALDGNAAGNTTGSELTAIGTSTLSANAGGTNNTAVGFQSQHINTTGSMNTAVGDRTLHVNLTGSFNTAMGESALLNNTGSDNDAFGYFALSGNQGGITNDAFGTLALTANTTGESNDAFGYEALSHTNTPNNNSAFGFKAGITNTTGANNTFMGYNTAATNTTGSNNTALGFMADVGANNLTDATAIGANAIAKVSDAIQLGDANICYVGTFGHIRSELPASTVAAAAANGVFGSATLSGTDVAGIVSVTSIVGAGNGTYVTITFGGCAYDQQNIVITSADGNTGSQLWFVTPIANGFTISRQVPIFKDGSGNTCDCQWPKPTGQYTWFYHVIDTGTP